MVEMPDFCHGGGAATNLEVAVEQTTKIMTVKCKQHLEV